MTRTRTHRRAAFTLPELLVAMALSIGIMWILAESFKMGLDFTSKMRSTGQQASLLSGAGMVMTRDLQAEHFLPDDNKPNRGVRLSDQRLDWLNSAGQGWVPPKGGFFRIISPAQASAPIVDRDGFGINTAANHALHFTSILPVSDQNPYTATVNGVPGQSRAAEIAYFLVDSGLRTSPGPTGQPLYNLIRRQRLVALTDDEKASLAAVASDTGVVASNGAAAYTLADLTLPNTLVPAAPLTSYRLPIAPNVLPGGSGSPPTFAVGSSRYGEDILLSHVLSFEVLVDWDRNVNVVGSRLGPRPFTGDPATASPPAAAADRVGGYPGLANTEYPFDNLLIQGVANSPSFPQASGVFDTWAALPNWNVFTGPNATPNNKLPMAARVKQLQITIRIFDPKTKSSRQNTWKHGM